MEKSSEWSCFNFSRFEPGSLKKFSLSFSIALEDIVKFFAGKRYQERERPILTKIKTKLDILNEIPPQVNEIPQHFIHEIKTKGYDVIGVNLFLPKLMRFLPRKEA